MRHNNYHCFNFYIISKETHGVGSNIWLFTQCIRAILNCSFKICLPYNLSMKVMEIILQNLEFTNKLFTPDFSKSIN